MKMRKLLSLILVMSMLLSIVPATAFAQEENQIGNVVNDTTTTTLDNLFLNKNAVLTEDGTYTINLEAYATGTTITQTVTEGVPLDVVLVLDQSGSLRGDALTTLKDSVNVFLESLRANGEECGVNHRVAMCGFASYGKQGASAWEAAGYSYANTVHGGAWVNTGIFVDGKFKDYGEAEYIPITSYEQININSYYAIWHDSDGDGINEYSRVFMTIYEFQGNDYYCWVAKDGSELGYSPVTGGYIYGGNVTVKQLSQLLFNEFEGYLFEVGETSNLLSNEDYAASWENVSVVDDGKVEVNPVLTEAVGNLSSNGATATFIGMKMARKMLENLPTEADNVQRKKLVVVFTDGEPGAVGYAQGDADAALAEASKIKAGGTEIYAVGIYDNPTSETIEFMNQLSSNYGTHSFNTDPQKIDVSIGSYTELNGVLLYTRNDDATRGGVSPYFYKDNKGNYWPVYLYSDPVVSSTDYYAYYITDEGEIPLGSGTVDEFSGNVYLLNKPTASIPDEGYYKTSTNIDDLSGIFESISSEVTSYTSQISLDADAILKDVLADGFTLTDNTTITVSVVPGSVKDEYASTPSEELTSDKIEWDKAQQVLTFAYPAATKGTGTVTVNGAADKTAMTITATASADGVVTVTGFNYAKAEDADNINAQYISYGHSGSKLVVTITGVEAKANAATNTTLATNKGDSGIYESAASDNDGDNETGEMQAAFPVPTTHLTSKTYYLDSSNSVVIDPTDFLMTTGGINADPRGYHYFNPAAPGTSVKTAYGTVTIREDGKLVYTMTADNWKNNDVFYLFGETTSTAVTGASANATGNMWSKIVIVPPEDIRGNLFLNKDAILTENGTYTIDLEAYATSSGTTRVFNEGVPLDVVLVMDQSGSLVLDGDLLPELKNSVNVFLQTLYANGEATNVDHRVAICGFGSYGAQIYSGVVNDGLSYAGERQDLGWVNTGIFVDGEFLNFGKLEYEEISDYSNIVGGKIYAVDYDSNNDGKMERVRVQLGMLNSIYLWYVPTANGNYYTLASSSTKLGATKQLFSNYTVYEIGDSSNQLSNDDYRNAWEYISDGQGSINSDVMNAAESLASNGATSTFVGMKMARKLLETLPTQSDGVERKKVVIVFTDGEPGVSGYAEGDAYAALAEAAGIKNGGAEIYTVGIYDSASASTVETFMNQLSSNYAGHDFVVADTPIDPSKGATSNNGFLCYSTNVNNTRGGIYPYFYKDAQGNYWPVYIHYDATVSTITYEAAYITDDGEVPIENFEAQTYYTLAVPTGQDNEGYYKHASDISDLSEIFETITTEVTTFDSKISLDANAILKDVMADGFKLTNSTITVYVVPGSVSEENSGIPADELTPDKIEWDTPQQVLSFAYPNTTERSGKVKVNGAADQTEMTLTATVSADGVITVTGFNYAGAEDENKINAQYISAGHAGSKLVVTITGVEAAKDVATDVQLETNKNISGVYESVDSDTDGDGNKGEIQASFPIPTTYITSNVYVLDYAKEMSFAISDLLMSNGAITLNKEGYHFFSTAVADVSEKYGKVVLGDGSISYIPINMNWDGYDTFYVFGKTENTTVTSATANREGYMWAKVSVLPANNVYYEDSFVNSQDSGTAGIIYEGAWNVVGTDGNQGENAESGENADHGGVHGWEDTLADDHGFSDGSANASQTPGATATFTFTGTGVDIYSRTNSTTGIIIAMLYKGASVTGEDGKNLIAEYALMVDNLSASGDYYQVPTLSLCQIPVTDENGNTVMTDLDYGTYTVKIIVSKATDSQTGYERFLYYLDGIRVYNPIKNQEDDSVVNGAYGERNELNANFVEIRDKLLDAGSFADGDTESAGPVFIDRITSEEGNHNDKTTTTEISTYEVFGPKNEVYLSAGQMIAFAVEYQQDAHYYIGLKSLTGKLANVKLFDAEGNAFIVAISHTTDLYYEVFPVWEYDAEGNPTKGVIAVMFDATNSDADAILSLTKLKTTSPNATTFKFARISNTKLLTVADDLAKADIVVAGDTPPDSNPAEGEQTILQKLMMAVLKRVFGDLRGWFKP